MDISEELLLDNGIKDWNNGIKGSSMYDVGHGHFRIVAWNNGRRDSTMNPLFQATLPKYPCFIA